MELKIVWFLIVTVLTPNGMTQFDLEYKTRQDCIIALNNTQLAQELARRQKKDGPRIWKLECREWPLDIPQRDRRVRI